MGVVLRGKKGGGGRVFQPSSARRGVGKKNIGNKGEACRSVECIGRTVLLQRRTAVCNHIDFYGISYYREIYGEERGKRRLYGRLSCDYSNTRSRGVFVPANTARKEFAGGCDFYCTFYRTVKLFFPPRKTEGGGSRSLLEMTKFHRCPFLALFILKRRVE